MAQKISYWLLITLLISLGFGQLLRFDYLGIPIYLHDALVVIVLALQGPTLKVKIPLSLKLFFTGLALGWISVLIHYPLAQFLVPSLYTLRLLAYLSLYLMLRQSKIKIPIRYFLIGGLVQWLIGVIQYFLLPDMRVFQYLGWDDHLNRLTLPHFDPTFTAVMLSLFLLTIVKFKTPYSILHALYTIPAILLTYSRSVWLTLAVTGLLFIKNKKILLISGVLFLVSIFALPQKFGEGNNLLRTYSITSRFESDLAFIQKYKWDLLLGRGMNTLMLDAPRTELVNHARGPNNSYLYLLATTGVLGLYGWCRFLYSLYRRSAYKPLLLFIILASLFNNVMFYPFALLWVLLLESTAPSAI